MPMNFSLAGPRQRPVKIVCSSTKQGHAKQFRNVGHLLSPSPYVRSKAVETAQLARGLERRRTSDQRFAPNASTWKTALTPPQSSNPSKAFCSAAGSSPIRLKLNIFG